MTPTEELIDYGVKHAKNNPQFRHAVGTIRRQYVFNINDNDFDSISVLGAGFAAMRIVYEDLANYINEKKIITSDLPDLTDIYSGSSKKLEIIFKLKDGSILTEKTKAFTREQLLESAHLAVERYGITDAEVKTKSDDKVVMLREYFNIAKVIFCKDGYHAPMIFVRSKNGSTNLICPVYKDRAEKMLFINNLAKKVKKEKIMEIIFITESWTHADVEKANEHLEEGKEFELLEDKRETLDALYFDSGGAMLRICAPIIRSKDGAVVSLGEVFECSLMVDKFHIFYPIFYAWGLVKKI